MMDSTDRVSDREQVEIAFTDARQTETGWFRATCPFCPEKIGKTDRRRSLSIEPGTWFYKCWRCGTRGKLREAPSGHAHAEKPAVDYSKIDLEAPEGFLSLLDSSIAKSVSVRPAVKYLLSRGVTWDTIYEAAIGICFKGRAAQRIVVPVFAEDDETWIGWVGRAWDKASLSRYMYPIGMPRGELLYNTSALFLPTDEPLLIVEGVYDALPHWPNASSCLGKPTGGQIKLMLLAQRPLVIALDGDAWPEAESLATRLRFDGFEFPVGWMHLPPRTDPGNFPRESMHRLKHEALERSAWS